MNYAPFLPDVESAWTRKALSIRPVDSNGIERQTSYSPCPDRVLPSLQLGDLVDLEAKDRWAIPLGLESRRRRTDRTSNSCRCQPSLPSLPLPIPPISITTAAFSRFRRDHGRIDHEQHMRESRAKVCTIDRPVSG